MRESLHEPVRSYQSKHSFKKAFRRIACVLGCIVAFITTYALILPAITLEQTAFCGIEEHTHNESCYGQQIENRNLVCTAGLELHIHSAECYAADGSVICGQADYIVHSHDSSCWNTSGELICTLPERTQHVHDTGCYYTPEPVPHSHSEACVVNVMGDLVCTQQVSEGHKHGDSCYQTTDELVCTKVAEHTHIEECYDSEGLLCCALEENHVHDHTCYRQELICQTPESEGHSHDDNCYLWEQGYGCGLEEGQPEAVEPQLVCNEAVAPVHVHDDSCFEVSLVDAEPVCGQTHEHTYSCYPLICTLTEHTHELQCYSDPNADVENRQVWEATMQNVELTGDWCADVVAIAESQLGYTESTRNYQVGADNAIYGYTRYGDWYGSPYGDWCAMFVSFCLDYAQVENFPQEANCPAWVSKLQEREMYAEAEGYIPAAGDVIFFDWNANGLSDHMGIVAKVDGQTLKTIEGNTQNAVRYVNYDINDPTILGYGFLPVNAEEKAAEVSWDSLLNILICGTPAHTHADSCYDAEGQLLCAQQAHIHTIACADPSSPVGYVGTTTTMWARFALRTSGDMTYHTDVAPMLSKIVIVDDNETTIYNSEDDSGSKEITLGDMYQVTIQFQETTTDQFSNTEKLYYQIPDFLVSNDVNNGIITDKSGNIVAHYTIHGNQLIVTQDTDFFAIHNDSSFEIAFDAEAVFTTDSDKLDVDFSDQYQITLNTKENGTINSKKELVSYDPLTRTITYKCTTTAHGGTVNLSEISDWWWFEGVKPGDVTISGITLTDGNGNNVTDQWNIVINLPGSSIWMAPWPNNSPYYLDHGESITMTYQVHLANDLTENFNFQNTYTSSGTFNSNPLYDEASIVTPITFTNIEKSGVYVTEDVNGETLDALEWTVEVANQKKETITITDQLGERQTFCTHQPIKVKAVKEDGTKESIDIPWTEVKRNDANTRFELTLPGGYVEYELVYYSHYELEANNPDIQIFENTVTTNIYIGDIPTTGTGSVGVLGVPPGINKQITASDDQWLTYSVECFMPGILNNRTSVILYDTLASWGATDGFIRNDPDNLTVTVTPVGGDAYQLVPYTGQATDGTYLMDYDGQSFTMYFNTSQAQSASSVWKCDTDSTLTVSYRVSLDSPMLDSWGGEENGETLRQFLERTGQKVYNEAQLNYSPTDFIFTSVTYVPPKEPAPPLTKTGKLVEGQDGVYEYSVWFNAGEDQSSIFSQVIEGNNAVNDVAELTLTDTFDSRMEYVEGSLQVSIWGYWNHEELVLNYSPKDNSIPKLKPLADGKMEMTVSASDLIGQEGSTWLTGKPLLYALKYLPEGYQYEFTYKLRVKDEVKKTSTDGVLELDNSATIDWTESTGPKSVGPAESEVLYDTGILDKTMHTDEDRDLVNVSIMINHNALDLAPGSETYVLHDKMSANLMLVYNSLTIEILDQNGNVTETRTPQSCDFTYDPTENEMTFTMPDSKIIRLKYDCRVNDTGGQTVDVGNRVWLEGYSSIQDVVNAEFHVRDHTGSADASSKSFILQKQDRNTLRVLPGVSFKLYGDTERTGSDTIQFGTKTLYYYETFTTAENGMIEVAETQLSAGHLYALVEVAPPEGYMPLEEPYVFYMVYVPAGGIAGVDVVAEGALVVIQNTPIGYELPETGGAGNYWYTMAGLLLMLTSTAYLLYRYKKRRKEVR